MSYTNEELSRYARQTNALVHAFETALGKYVKNLCLDLDGRLPGPAERFWLQQRKYRDEPLEKITISISLEEIVGKTYLQELLQVASIVEKELHIDSTPLDKLKELCETLKLPDIRNQACHPNQSFHENYWWRMAVIATHPCLKTLGNMKDLHKQFYLAKEGKLYAPEDWVIPKSFEIPHNLPDYFDHDITRLIGRKKEKKELRKLLQTKRNALIAILGVGGAGKTALCLEVLKECIQEPETSEWCEHVIYVTAKTEQLTIEGVQEISSARVTLKALKSEIACAILGWDEEDVRGDTDQVFELAVEHAEDKKILLCIDNLETILRGDAEEFDAFHQELPPSWRVVVTSRVTVDGAKTLSLGGIEQAGAVTLAQVYAQERHIVGLSAQQHEYIVTRTEANPLAIRLMLDSYKHGQDLSNAAESTIHNILEFSYTSLIEALPQSAYIMLEALFLLGKPSSRGQVRYLTELSADAMAEAIRSLSNTSLIIRRSVKSHENLELNGSVHELLSNHNKDPRTRQKINARLVKQQTAVQQEGMYPFHPLSVPGEIESWARGVVNELSEAFTRDASANERHQAISRIRENKQQPKYPACFDRIEGILLLQESQGVEAVKAFHKALSKDPNDVAAKMGLSEAQLSLNQLESGLETAHQLISTWHEKWDELKRHTKRRLFGNAWQHYAEFYTPEKLFNSLLEIGCFTDVDDIHISVRLRALEKRFDGQRMSISDETRWLQRAKQCFEDWKDFRYMSGLNTDALRLLRRFKRNSDFGLFALDSKIEIAELIRIHAQGIAIANPGNPLIKKKLREQIQYWRTELADNPSNPLSGTEWEDPDLGQLSPTEKMLSRSGYVPVEITSPCKTDRNALQYFFGEGNDRQRFFLHSGTATEMSNEEFGGLSRGDRVWVKPGDQLNSKNTPASHIVKL